MPSQSSLDGSAIPDHWIRIGSPDLAKTVGVRERETLDWVDELKREMIVVMKRMNGVREFFIFLGIFQVGEECKKKEKLRVFFFLVALFILCRIGFLGLL